MSGVIPPQASVGTRSGRKAKGEGHSRRAEILVAAERIFIEHGYEGATIRKIADEVGLSSTALYMHFAEKGEILQEICRVAFAQLLEVNRRIAAEPEEPEDKLRRMLDYYVDFGFANPNAYRLVYMTRPAEARDGAQTTAQSLGAELFRSFESVVEQLAAAGRIKGDPKVAAQVFWAGAHGIVSLAIAKPYFPWVEQSALRDTMSKAMFEGLLRS